MSLGEYQSYPLTDAQQRIWNTEILYPNTALCLLSGIIKIKTRINKDLLEKSINNVIKTNDALRIRLIKIENETKQLIADYKYRNIDFIDFDDPNSRFKSFDQLKAYNLEPLELINSELFDFLIFKVSDNEYGYTAKIHHVISDGVSMENLFEQILDNYERLEQKTSIKEHHTPSYIDYIHDEIEYKESERYEIDQNYWLETFRHLPENLKTNLYNPLTTSTASNRKTLIIDGETLRSIKNLCKESRVNLFTFFQAILYIYINKTTNSQDIVIGTNYSNRVTKREKNTIGMFTSTVASRMLLDSDETIISFLKRLFIQTSKNMRHQRYPYNELIQEIRRKQNITNLHRLFGIAMEYRPFKTFELNGQKVDFEDQFCGDEANDLTIHIVEKLEEDHLIINFDYRKYIFNDDEMETLIKRFRKIIKYITEHQNEEIKSISFISKDEKNVILEKFNNTRTNYPRNQVIQELFEEQVKRTPDQIAVVCDDKYQTYKELNKKANQLARTLEAEGVGPDHLVGVMAESSLDMIVGVLGILKAGGAYVPIDPDYPKERVQYMLNDAGVEIVLSQSHLQRNIQSQGLKIFNLDEQSSYHQDGTNMEKSVSPTHLAYVLYTSGTTGKPKGVMVEHRNVIRLVKQTNYVTLDEETRILQTGNMVFDASTFEIWGPLLNSGQLYLTKNKQILDVVNLKELIERYHINTMWLTSPLFNQLTAQNIHLFEHLETLIIGGDVLSVTHVNKIKRNNPRLKLINGYGPTENTTFSTTFAIQGEQEGSVPIGKPIANSKVYILDRSLNLQPIGVWGELVVAGDGVARGYLNCPDVTAEKFLESPYVSGERMYRTGDLARWLPNGNIEYLGRMDHQVKIRGYRIEIGEIEMALLNIKGVQEAIVIPKEQDNGEKALCAYFVAKRSYLINEMKEQLSELLPHYMIPSYLVQLKQMPLTPNGKIDRKLLPKPEEELQTGTEYVAPRNPVEETLTEIWQKVLGLSRVGIKDNFFEVGGDSLRATNAVVNINKELKVDISLKEIFTGSTIEDLAKIIEKSSVESYDFIPVIEEKDYYPVSSAQKRMYILSHMVGNELTYNMPHSVQIDGELNIKNLESAFKRLIQRHDSLRTSFKMINGEPKQFIQKNIDFSIKSIQATFEDLKKNQSDFLYEFDLTKAPLMRVKLLKINSECHILMIDMHHIISDGTSINIFMKELFDLYEGKQLPELRIQYKDYVAWQLELQDSEKMKRNEDYWLKVFTDDIPLVDMPTDYERPIKRSYEGSLVNFKIDNDLYRGLNRIAEQTGSTLYMVLLASYTILLSKYTGLKDISVGTPVSGRNHSDIEGIIGMFVNTLVIRNRLSFEKTFIQYLNAVKETTLDAFENQDYLYERLVEKVDVKKVKNRNPLFDTMLAIENVDYIEKNKSSLNLKSLEQVHTVSRFDLTLFIHVGQNELRGSFEYCTKLFKRSSVELLVRNLKTIISIISKNPSIKLSDIKLDLDIKGNHNQVDLFELNF
ncbi:amino acid adenylation domain-containing protein [Priestia sp. WB3]